MELGRSYTYDELVLAMKKLAADHAPKTAIEEIGTSHAGREIHAMHLGKGEKAFFFISGIHGCENVNPPVLVKVMETYAKAYEIPENWRMIFVPLANPDGYEYARISQTQIRFNARGVDINRNFSCQSYVGSAPDSENETRCLKALFKAYPSKLLIDFHSRGKSIFYHRRAMGEAYNRRSLEIARKLMELTGYGLEAPQQEIPAGDVGGNSVQHYSERYQMPALTMETVSESEAYPLSPHCQKETYEEIKEVPYMAAMLAQNI